MSTLEKTWQCIMNQVMATTNTPFDNNRNSIWWWKAFLCGQLGGTAVLAGQWRVYSSCDGSGNVLTVGNGDYKDYWGTVGAVVQGPTAGASTTTGASTNRLRITGLSGMTSESVGRYLELSGAGNANNNSPGVVGGVSTQPFKIVNYVSATTVDIYNPTGVTGGSGITWTERSAHTLNTSKIVHGADPTNHSWIVLESWSVLPDGPVYVTIDCNNLNIYQATILWSKTAPAAGDINSRPTAADEVTATGWTLNAASNGNAQYMSGALSTDGNFVILSVSKGNGYLTHLIIFQRLADTKAGDACPFNMIAYNTTVGSPSVTELVAVANNGTRNFTNASTIRCPAVPFSFSAGPILTTASASGGMPVQDNTDGLYASLPVYCCNITVGQYTIKGRLYDICWAPSLLADNAAEPSVAGATKIKIGTMWFPINAQLVLA